MYNDLFSQNADTLIQTFNGLNIIANFKADKVNIIILSGVITPSQLKYLNNVSVIVIEYDNDKLYLTIVETELIVQGGLNSWDARSLQDVRTGLTISGNIRKLSNSQWSLELFHNVNRELMNLTLKRPTSITNLSAIQFPHVWGDTATTNEFSGELPNSENIPLTFYLGATIEALETNELLNFSAFDETEEEDVFVDADENIPVISSAEYASEGRTKLTIEITKELTAQNFGRWEMRITELDVETMPTFHQRSNNFAKREFNVDGFTIGKRYFAVITHRDSEGIDYPSEKFFFVFNNPIIVTSDKQYRDLSLMQSSVHHIKRNHNSLEYKILNHLFLTNEVTEIIVIADDGDTQKTFTKDISGVLEFVDITLTDLDTDTQYFLTFYAKTTFEDIKISEFFETTSKLLTGSSSSQTNQAIIRSDIFHMGLDYDTAQYIENLTEDEQKVTACDLISQLNNADVRNLLGEKNRTNKKASVFRSSQSDLESVEYSKLLDVILAKAYEEVEDIDEGFR